MQKRTYDTVQGWKCYGKGNDIWDLDIGYKLRWVYSYPFFLYFSRFILTTRCRLRNGIRLMAWQFFYFIVTAFLPTRTVALIESRALQGYIQDFIMSHARMLSDFQFIFWLWIAILGFIIRRGGGMNSVCFIVWDYSGCIKIQPDQLFVHPC